jgi:integrase
MTGSLQEKNGRYYMVFSTMKDGKQQLKWKSTGLTVKGNKRRAEEMLKAALQEYEKQEAAMPKGDIPMPELVREWLKVKRREIRANSYTSYEETAVNHVIPYFEALGVTAGQLTTAQIKQYYNAKFAEGLKPESLTRHRTILRGALDYSIETLDLLSVNVADRAKLPKNSKKRTPTYYDAAQIKKLFQEAQGESIEAPVRLAATYGMRRSEALGLMWSAVDFKKKTVRIQHTVVRDGTDVIYDDTVKETASYRTMPLTKDMEAYLKALQAHQKQMKKLGGKNYHNSDYVCVWDDGRPLEPDYVTSRFGRFLKDKNLPHIRFHDLRHSSASLLVNSGYTLEEVMKWLGHASIRSTERYAHLQASSKNEMAAKVNEMLSLG